MENIEEDNIIRKEEILEKSRQSQHDEGVEYAVSEGAKKGTNLSHRIIGFPLLILSVLAGQLIVVYALGVLNFAHDVGDFYAKYRILNQKRYLIATICFAVLGSACAVLFVRDIGFLQGWWG